MVQGRVYRLKEQGKALKGQRVALVLGAGNQTSVVYLDILHMLLVEDCTVVCKINPVNAFIASFLECVCSLLARCLAQQLQLWLSSRGTKSPRSTVLRWQRKPVICTAADHCWLCTQPSSRLPAANADSACCLQVANAVGCRQTGWLAAALRLLACRTLAHIKLCRAAFAPLIQEGFLHIVHGGPHQGAFLGKHRLVTHIHLTGSGRTHDAIVWGSTPKVRSGYLLLQTGQGSISSPSRAA